MVSETFDPYLDKWNRRHGEAETVGEPTRVLLRNAHLLPRAGRALDLACGRGGSALWLAERGLEVHAWDFSEVGLQRLTAEAGARDLTVTTSQRDVVVSPPEPASFDLILVSYFLERDILPSIEAALRPGGLLCYQTFVQDRVSDLGPSGPAWRFAENELLHAFPGLVVRYYREEGTIGDTSQGIRDIALLVASKPLA